ncbi:MAG: DJ-1/PfpI family protein [Myxococcota bacterium]
MHFILQILGIAPTAEKTGRGYIPSPLGLFLGVDKRSGYQPTDFGGRKYVGDKKVLVLCTEERYQEMTSGVLFSTGMNVQETTVPLMHLTAAGFDFDVVTPTGAPAVLEQWSVPRKDEAVLAFLAAHQAKFDRPLSLADLIARRVLDEDSPYVALFLPGGHGAMVGLPDDKNVGALIRWVKDTDRYLVAVCHGPAALLATTKGGDGPHPYAGYALCAFPDSIDRQSPAIGYLPGTLPWFQCERLETQGMRVVNSGAKGETHVDRKLYTGDSPKACDQLGKMIAEALLSDRSTTP